MNRESGAMQARLSRIDEHRGVAGRQRVAALVGRGADVVDVEDRADGLLLEPFPGIARIDAGRSASSGAVAGPPSCERPVQSEPVAEVDRLDVE